MYLLRGPRRAKVIGRTIEQKASFFCDEASFDTKMNNANSILEIKNRNTGASLLQWQLSFGFVRIEVRGFININPTLQDDAFGDFSTFSVEYLVDLSSMLHVSVFQVD